MTCPYGSCVLDFVYAGHGDFFEVVDCYCEEVGELPFAPGLPEVIENDDRDYESARNVES